MISSDGLKLIKYFEGFSPLEYTCVGGKRTIGYGHVLKPGEAFPGGVTQEQAEELLAEDVGIAEDAVIRLVKVALTPHQFDALVSFVFNVGARNFAGSALLKKLNAGDYSGAAEEFKRWKYAGGRVCRGLVCRREAEAKLYSSD